MLAGGERATTGSLLFLIVVLVHDHDFVRNIRVVTAKCQGIVLIKTINTAVYVVYIYIKLRLTTTASVLYSSSPT